MKKPNTFEEFEKLILNMDHRERFIFDTGKKFMEIYCTVKLSQRGNPVNYNFSYWNDKETKPVNRQKEYVTADILKSIYQQIEA